MFSPIVLVDGVFYPRDFALREHAYYTTHNTYTHVTRRVIYLGRGYSIICFAYYYVIMTTLYQRILCVPTRIMRPLTPWDSRRFRGLRFACVCARLIRRQVCRGAWITTKREFNYTVKTSRTHLKSIKSNSLNKSMSSRAGSSRL